MKLAHDLVKELTWEIHQAISNEGIISVATQYSLEQEVDDHSVPELVQLCVSKEMENYFR